QASLHEAYNRAADAIETASTLEEVFSLADILSRYPQLIRASHQAYLDYEAAIENIASERAARPELYGEYTALLDTYLNENKAEVEGLKNGTYPYILETKLLDNDELKAEAAFAKELLENAIRTSITPGTDLSSLIVNAGFEAGSAWNGWEHKTLKTFSDDANFTLGTGYLDIYSVAGSFNASFYLQQDIKGDFPDGIYEITVPAALRNGNPGEGFAEDLSSAELYINDYYTPIMNAWEDVIRYEDAINGVNCRYDSQNDETAPHNGQDITSIDHNTGEGYIIGQGRQCVSFAFAAGRYINKAYAIVTDGMLRIGLRNTADPWYDKQMTVWGRFELKYYGYDEDIMETMLDKFEYRKTKLTYGMEGQEYYFSRTHLTHIEQLIASAREKFGDEKATIIQDINEVFNTIYSSHDIWNNLMQLMYTCYECSDALIDSDPTLSQLFFEKGLEIEQLLETCTLTDEEAQAFYDGVYADPVLGRILRLQSNYAIHVSPEGDPEGYGDTWETATTIEHAVALANNRKNVDADLWLKEGTYLLDNTLIIEKMHIYGGFAGTEENLDERNWALHPSIIDGQGKISPLRNDLAAGGVTTTIVDGVIVQHGFNQDGVNGNGNGGGGIFKNGAVIRNCIFRNNMTGRQKNGAALHCHAGTITLENCLFANNQSTNNGGAIQIGSGVTAKVVNCTFVNNQAEVKMGGAIGVADNTSHLTITNSILWNNLGNGLRNSYS
ncbi:MAG: right-handed parallel beta-helix repeat-containing protein, partial [Bacteroidaceae bacterium]|nr:right-handed parallel beta-helix repeat-containing protein [Bacteroidaceae bacterium]